MRIRKAVIPIAGLGTRFLPLSKSLPKELFPLADKPVLQYIIEELAASGIKEIVFVTKPEKELILDYFEKRIKSKRVLKAKYRSHFLKELKSLENLSKNISFSKTIQKEPLGDGHAVLQARSSIKEPFAVAWSDDVVKSKIPCLLQLIRVFQKYQKPILALAPVSKQNFQFYGMVKGDKIAERTYRIRKIVEKPSIKKSPSNLAIVGRYVLTPKVFDYLKKAKLNQGDEIILDEVLRDKVEKGEEVYGYEFDGKWLECGNKLAYLKSNFYLSLKHPQFGKEIRKFLKK